MQIFFTPASDRITPEAVENIQLAAESASIQNAQHVVVRGIAETSRGDGSGGALARSRASAVAAALQVRGVSAQRIEVQSHEFDCAGSAPDAQDQRVEIFPVAAH